MWCFYITLFVYHLLANVLASDWRFTAHDGQFATKREVSLDYYGSGTFNNWNVDSSRCTFDNPSTPSTSIKCNFPGIYTVTANIDGSEQSKLVKIRQLPDCYSWFITTQFSEMKSNGSFVCTAKDHGDIDMSPADYIEKANIWIIDPPNANPDELDSTATSPSTYSKAMTRLYKGLGEKPFITFKSGGLYSRGSYGFLDTFDDERGMWNFSLHIETFHQPMILIGGYHTSHYGCSVRDESFLLGRNSFSTSISLSAVAPVGPAGSPNIEQDACIESTAAVISDQGVYLTDDGFRTSTKMEALPTIDGANAGRTEIAFTKSSMLVLIGDTLHRFNRATSVREVVNDFSPATILGLRTRDLCNEGVDTKLENDVFLAFTAQKIYLSKSSDTQLSQFTPDSTVFSSLGTLISITDVAFSVYPGRITVAATVTGGAQPYNVLLALNWLSAPTWKVDASVTSLDVNDVYLLRHLPAEYEALLWWSGSDLRLVSGSNPRVSTTIFLHSGDSMPDLGKQLTIGSNGMYVFGLSSGDIVLGRSTLNEATKLSSDVPSSTPQCVWFDGEDRLYMLTLAGNGKPSRRLYPIENQLLTKLTTADICPYSWFGQMGLSPQRRNWISLDLGKSAEMTTSIVFPTNLSSTDTKLDVTIHDPNDLVNAKTSKEFIVTQKNTEEKVTIKLDQNGAYNHEHNILRTGTRDQSGVVGVDIRPKDGSLACKNSHDILYISLGCLHTKNIRINRTYHDASSETCAHSGIKPYTVVRQGNQEDKTYQYDYDKLGCPIRVKYNKKFIPEIILYDGNDPVKKVLSDYIVWEKNARTLSYNSTMAKIRCNRQGQTWAKITEDNPNGDLSQVWGPHNYESCFVDEGEMSYEDKKTLAATQYETMNSSGANALVFAEDRTGIFIINLKIVDPTFSFCDLQTQFGIEVYGADAQELSERLLITLGVFIITLILVLIFSFYYFRIYVYRRDELEMFLLPAEDMEGMDYDDGVAQDLS